jgi:hypothetical protein
VELPKMTYKAHAFKNFKCTKHNLFFSLDVYTLAGTYNYHHMRLNPVTNINEVLMEQFFKAAGVY